MQFEPSWALNIVLIAGLAGLYVWYLLAESTILNPIMGWPREKFPLLIGCPWCSGLWITAAILLATQTYDPITHLASSAVVGFLGSKSDIA